MIQDDPARTIAAPKTVAGPPASRPGQELLIHLSRAVQRASIYPPGHPAVRGASLLLHNAVATLLEEVSQVAVGVTRERVFVGIGRDSPNEFEPSWLSRRLAARGIASVAFDRGLVSDEAMRLVSWLALSDELVPGVAPPAFTGALVVPIDFSHARFRDAPMQRDDEAEADVVWRAMAQTLVGDWEGLGGDTPPAPADLARRALELIDRYEGTGAGELAGRLFGLAPDVAALSPEVQDTVKRRLGEFVAALSPELRLQLLTVVPADDPSKLDLICQLLDRLPSAQVIEVIQNVQFSRGDTNHKFLTLMVKLVNVAAASPVLAEAVEERFSREGLPVDIAYLEAPDVQRVLEELLAKPSQPLEPWTPEAYEAQLNALARPSTVVSRRRASDRYVDPLSADLVALEVGHIALQLLDDAHAAERVACVARVERDLPRFLDAGRFDTLVRAHESTTRMLADGRAEDPRTIAHARAVEKFFPLSDTVGVVVGAIANGTLASGATLSTIAAASGPPLVEALVDATADTGDPGPRGRLAEALLSLDPDVVRSVVKAVYRREREKACALLAALSGLPGQAFADVALLYVTDREGSVRLDAYRLLFNGGLSPARFDSVARRALADADAGVVDLALHELAAQPPAGRTGILGEFLASRSASRWERQHLRAAALLGEAGTPEAKTALADVLDRSRWRLGAAARRVAFAIAERLDADEDEAVVAAVRGYRRSAAGVLGRLLGQGRGGSR